MLSLEPTPHARLKMRFPAFDWLDDIPVDDWTGHSRGQHSMQFTLKELARRGDLERCEDVVDAFRAWAFAHKGRRYAILWSGDREPDDSVMIAMLDTEPARRRKPAKDPQDEGWMW